MKAPLMLLAVLAFLGFPEVGHPQDPIPDFTTEWRWADFDQETGYSAGRVLGMVEVGDTLWVGSEEGLFWYDGFHWRRVGNEQGLPQARLFSMAAMDDGRLAVVLEGRVYGGTTEAFHRLSPQGWDESRFFVRRIVSTSQGLLLTVLDEPEDRLRVFLWTVGGSRELSKPGPMSTARGLWPSGTGGAFMETDDGLFRFQDEGWERVVGPSSGDHSFSGVWEAADGSGFASQLIPVSDRGLLLWDESGDIRRLPSEGEYLVTSGVTTHDRLRILVYETGDVRILHRDQWSTPAFSRLRSEGLHYVFEDHRGDLWFASSRGLHLFKRSLHRWSTIRFPFPDARNRVNDLLVARSGEVWLATHGGVGRMDPEGRVEWIREVLGQDISVSTGLAEDREGGVWITSGATFPGAFRYFRGEWERFGPQEGGPPGRIHRVSVAEDGTVWFASLGRSPGDDRPGAFRWNGESLERVLDERGWLDQRTYAIEEGPDGSIWFGTLGGLLRWKAGSWMYWDPEERLGTGMPTRVFTILPDSMGGALVGFGPRARMGILRAGPDGSISDVGSSPALQAASVNEIREDPGGAIWATSDRGLFHISSGRWDLLDEAVGLSPAAAWPLAFRDEEVLVGSTGGGLQILNRQERKNPPPRIRVPTPPSVQGTAFRVAIQVASFRGQVPPSDIPVRYRLPDREWSEWGTFREISSEGEEGLAFGVNTLFIQARGPFGGMSDPIPVQVIIPLPTYLDPFFFIPVGLMALVVLGALGVGRVRKRRAEAVLRESESTLRTLVDTAPDGIAIYDADADRFLDVNTNVLTLTGQTREGFLSTRLGDTSPERLPDGSTAREVLLEKVEEALAGNSVTFEWFSRQEDGPPIPVEMRLVRLPSESGRLVRFSVLDIRDRKEAEEKQRDLEGQLRQSQKLEAIGQLTGGVAHDFNNLLTVIIGNLDLLREIRADDPETRELVDGAMGAAERSGLLTQRLLAFSRRQTLDSRPLDISDLVDGLLGLLTRSLGETVRVHVDLPQNLWPAQADPGQLEHSLVNLAVNARDAMPAGGDLYLEATNVRVETETADQWGGEPGDFVCISVTDTGFGMDAQTRTRAFEPFFTTKEVGAGSGLGLSMVYGFVKQSGGFVKIHSDLGRGTAVQIFLPRAQVTPSPPVPSEDAPGEAPLGHGEVVLVVEDEPLLLKLTLTLCENLGYQAVGASAAKGALDYIRSGKPVDLLFSDIILPGGMDGIQLALKARTILPDIPVLLTTGYAEQSVWRLTKDLSDYEFLSKPFDTPALARKLHGMLAD